MDRTNNRRPTSSRRPLLPDITLEVAARSFFKQALAYGFSIDDFVRFANILLGIAMSHGGNAALPEERTHWIRNPHTNLPLVGQSVSIRSFGEHHDRELFDRWLADPEGRFFLLSTASGRSRHVDEVLADPANIFGIILYQDQPIGCVAYLDRSEEQRRAELRKMIGEASLRGLGLAHEAAALWVGYGIGALGLRKIYLNTLATHIRNIKINEELGFQVEGILRNELLIDGEYHDVLRMGLCCD